MIDYYVDDKDRDRIELYLQKAFPRWKRPTKPLPTSPKWLPDFVSDNEVIHLHLVESLGEHFLRRFQAAKKMKKSVTIVGPAIFFSELDTLIPACELELQIIILEEGRLGSLTHERFRSPLSMIAKTGVQLTAGDFTILGNLVFDRALSSTTNAAKGKSFEDFLCLLFSQVSFLRVIDHNYRNSSEEIDVVMENRFSKFGPVSIATAKNQKNAVGTGVLKYLYGEMEKHDKCDLGFLCSARGISKEVNTELLKHTLDPKVVVPIDGSAFRRLLSDGEKISTRLRDLILDSVIAP